MHLIRRFFSYASARPLEQPERDLIVTWLPEPGMQALFFDQPVADQRHGFDAANWLILRGAEAWIVQAGLVHDIGKRHARLGRWRRSLATVLALIRIVPGGRLGIYTEHGPRGAAELSAAGADLRVVAYTAHHHESCPPEVSPSDWSQLGEADHRN